MKLWKMVCLAFLCDTGSQIDMNLFSLLLLERKRTQQESWSLWNYVPPVSLPVVPSLNLSSWLWSSSITYGPLVKQITGNIQRLYDPQIFRTSKRFIILFPGFRTDYKLEGRRGLHRNSPVWKYFKVATNQFVALKKLPYAGDNTLVFREAMFHHYLDHPNILALQVIPFPLLFFFLF